MLKLEVFLQKYFKSNCFDSYEPYSKGYLAGQVTSYNTAAGDIFLTDSNSCCSDCAEAPFWSYSLLHPRTCVAIPARLFLLAKLSREDDVGTHSNRERCRHWVQATDKTALTHMYGRCLPTTSIVTDEQMISKLLTQKSNKQGKWVVRHIQWTPL